MERLVSLIKREYKILFAEALADAIDGSDLELENYFFSGEMISLGRMSEKDVLELEDLNIRSILAEALPNNVIFRNLEYSSWAEDAANFCSLNILHPSFTEIFSVDKNYKIILQSLTDISQSSKSIMSVVQRDTKIDTKKRFYTTISEEMLQALIQLANEAYVPSLRALAHEIHRRHEKRSIIYSSKAQGLKKTISTSRSFKDRKGTVPFRISNDRLEIARTQSEVNLGQNRYRLLMKRALATLANNDVLIRIDNRDKILSNYIREYSEVFSSTETDESAIILYAIGEDAHHLSVSAPSG